LQPLSISSIFEIVKGRKTGGRQRGTPNRTTAATRAAQTRALRDAEITGARTILEIARVAFTDRRTIWQNGRLLPLEAWTVDQAACLEGLEVIVKNAQAGDGHTDTIHKVKLANKLHALEMLAKHFGLLVEKVEVSGEVTLLEKVARARARLAATSTS
jgi:hypothetical protein